MDIYFALGFGFLIGLLALGLKMIVAFPIEAMYTQVSMTHSTKTKPRRRARILTPEGLANLRYPLSESWHQAAGILMGKKIDPVKYQRELRNEWEQRLRKLERQWRKYCNEVI